MKNLFLFSSAFLMLTATLHSQVPSKWEDTNGDGFYDIEEFSKVYSKGYNDWDIDRDGRINNEEFYNNNYNRLDVNRDGRLTNEEWTSGRNMYGDYIPADRYAKNPPTYLSRTEFAKRFEDTDYYRSYDTDNDGFINEDELNQNTYNRLDRNRDGKLDAQELEGMQ